MPLQEAKAALPAEAVHVGRTPAVRGGAGNVAILPGEQYARKLPQRKPREFTKSISDAHVSVEYAAH